MAAGAGGCRPARELGVAEERRADGLAGPIGKAGILRDGGLEVGVLHLGRAYFRGRGRPARTFPKKKPPPEAGAWREWSSDRSSCATGSLDAAAQLAAEAQGRTSSKNGQGARDLAINVCIVIYHIVIRIRNVSNVESIIFLRS